MPVHFKISACGANLPYLYCQTKGNVISSTSGWQDEGSRYKCASTGFFDFQQRSTFTKFIQEDRLGLAAQKVYE